MPGKSASTRRELLQKATLAAAVPFVARSTVFGAGAASNRITMGCIGVGRMGRGDMGSFLGHSSVRILAVCDVDANRANHAKATVDGRYKNTDCAVYSDFRELIARRDIDAVTIATPNQWHVLPAIAAAEAGKDIHVQKPMTLTIREGRVLADTVRRYGRVLQVGSQHRSDSRLRFACELVRNGRVGKLHTVTVVLPTDPATSPQPPMPVPKGLDYDFWLGPAPWAPYTEKRVHPQKGYGRPGWLRCEDYSGGMMTGWGAHHNDIAQWGLGTECTGPVEIEGTGQFPKDGLWDVHGKFHVEGRYANGVRIVIKDGPPGIRFEGSDGWVWTAPGRVQAEPKGLVNEKIGPNEIHLYVSRSHKGNFLDCIKTRRDPIANVEIGHRSATLCHLANIAMKLGRKLRWNPDAEQFLDDDRANSLTHKPMRGSWHL